MYAPAGRAPVCLPKPSRPAQNGRAIQRQFCARQGKNRRSSLANRQQHVAPQSLPEDHHRVLLPHHRRAYCPE
eukprot:CAMPEP_0204499346 /NCGR_PEP_ID=MMETSP0471-20130131/94839_1 /ASSEMBLY_ACC=CAM_ASM_000602 /TAXON_ID=2969 /ORGANISM="Oxyrrhis marina" /LENGTH=72 /DNA_ID=CAMNT_0051503883 /DNA_START=11 /DNA_END=226 /DNA_ORIENTATION=+